MSVLQALGWLACVVYSTIPSFWFMVHPRAERWRARGGSPFRVLVPAWVLMWIVMGSLTAPWRHVRLYATPWSWLPAAALLAVGILLYVQSGAHFSWRQLGGLPEVLSDHHEQQLVTTGIRSRVRHPVYLGHLCEMLAWSLGTGLLVCWLMTGVAIITGAVMIRMEDSELEKRFGEPFTLYRRNVGAVFPKADE